MCECLQKCLRTVGGIHDGPKVPRASFIDGRAAPALRPPACGPEDNDHGRIVRVLDIVTR